MRTARLVRHSVIPIVAVAGLFLATGCGSSNNNSSSNTGNTSNVDVSALNADVTKAAELPSFSTYAAQYGGKVPTTGLAGKKIMIIPGAGLAACVEIAQATANLAKAVGMVPTIFSNDGTTAAHNTGIENAIHQHYAAIAFGCAGDPSTSSVAFKQAEAAGIAVSVYGATPQEAAAAGVTYNNVDPYALDAKIAAEQAVAQHNGKPFSSIAITSNAAPATAIMQKSLKDELKKDCPACTMTEVNVEVPQWQTDIQSTVSQALLQHPDVSVLFPDYAGMLTFML
ncbi:MAG: hypothetical protein J2P28_25840, partial [Actinobacteria bacterium]|nr:hypothetical protein [Actinomycetota bacterium]